MIKSELTQRVLAQNPHLFLRVAEKIVNVILGEIVAAMARGDRVETARVWCVPGETPHGEERSQSAKWRLHRRQSEEHAALQAWQGNARAP